MHYYRNQLQMTIYIYIKYKNKLGVVGHTLNPRIQNTLGRLMAINSRLAWFT